MGEKCAGNCIICGKCTTASILDAFSITGREPQPRDGYGIAVDIGTTSVVLALIDLAQGKTIARHSFLNPQRAFGPDVISRIDAANKGRLTELSQLITQSLSGGVAALLKAAGISPAQVADMAIAGNTVMTYLLLGLPCKSLGAAPFQPEYQLAGPYEAGGLFGQSGLSCQVRVIPWLAAYVGGDITAGLVYALPWGKGRFLLMDLGTNGEMALYDHGKLTVTATAAGPAFEQPVAAGGGSQPALQGASGVISALAALAREGAVDEAGRLKKEGVFTQGQVRELQLAKSAIRSGVEILLEITGLSCGDLEAVYLAGGIGQKMNPQDAVDIGLIPAELEAKSVPVGNASLGGAVAMLTAPEAFAQDTEKLLGSAQEINLAAHPRFNEYFMDYLYF